MGFGEYAARATREMRDRAAADGFLPPGSRFLAVDGARGWLCAVTSAAGDRYELFLYFDGSAYQAKVVAPDVEGCADRHACHLFPGGLICFGMDAGGGLPTLESAWAKSVLWVNGFSEYQRTGSFPF